MMNIFKKVLNDSTFLIGAGFIYIMAALAIAVVLLTAGESAVSNYFLLNTLFLVVFGVAMVKRGVEKEAKVYS